MVNLKVFLYGALNFFAPQFGRRTPCWGTGESSKHGPAYKPFDLEQTIRAGQHGVHDDSRFDLVISVSVLTLTTHVAIARKPGKDCGGPWAVYEI